MLPSGIDAALVAVSGPNSSRGVAPAIIAPPAMMMNPMVTNLAQEGFNERQHVTLLADLAVDGGIIPAGTVVDSHMIFLNHPAETVGVTSHLNVQWTFSGAVLGVMSDYYGMLESASTPILGAAGVNYEAFQGRGFETPRPGSNYLDRYMISGNELTVDMNVMEPGDWIRVVTAHRPVPDHGSTAGLMALALLGLFRVQRRLAARRTA